MDDDHKGWPKLVPHKSGKRNIHRLLTSRKKDTFRFHRTLRDWRLESADGESLGFLPLRYNAYFGIGTLTESV